MIHQITNRKTGTVWEVDETASESEHRSAEPLFYTAKFGKRETFDWHRGFLIARCTATFAGHNVRKTTVFIFGKSEGSTKPSSLCLGSDYSDARGARRCIDRMIEEKAFD